MSQRGGGKRNKLQRGPRPPKAEGHRNSHAKIQNPQSGSAHNVGHPKDGSGTTVSKDGETRIEDKCQKEASIELPSGKQNVQEDIRKQEIKSVAVDPSCNNSECVKVKEELRQCKETIKQLRDQIQQLTSKDCHQNNAAKEIMEVDTSTKHTAAPRDTAERVKRNSLYELPEKIHKQCKKDAKEESKSQKDKGLEQAPPKSWADDSIAEEEKYINSDKAADVTSIQDASWGDQANVWVLDNRASSWQGASWCDEVNDCTQSNRSLRRQDTNRPNAAESLPATNFTYDQPEQNRNRKGQSTYYGTRQQNGRSQSRDHRPQDKQHERPYQEQQFYHRQQQYRSREHTSNQGEQPMKRKRVVNEIEGDLFTAPKTSSLAHCVAEDMRMGSGIAVTFRQMFKRVDELLAQGAQRGDVAVLEDEGRFIYYLVTKRLSNGKPYLEDLRSSLIKMREHMLAYGVHNVAMPRIGCGLDRLEWREVKCSLIEIFGEDDVNITVYNFNQEQGERNQPRSSLRINHADYSLANIAHGTGRLYLGSEDGGISESLQNLLAKFPILQEYRQSKRRLGHFVRTVCKDEVLYGLIVKEKNDDKFSFTTFSRCLENLKSVIQKDEYDYVGIDAVPIGDDLQLATEKLITIFKYAWFRSRMDLYICWPKEYISVYRECYKESHKFMKQ